MARQVSKRGISNSRAAFMEATRALAEGERKRHVPIDPNLPRNGIKPGRWEGAPHYNMPPACPVRVLGHRGSEIFCISATNELMSFDSQAPIGLLTAIFAPHIDFMEWAWPAFGPAGKDADGNPTDPKIKRIERDKMMMCLISEGMISGQFDPDRQVRGRGGWCDRVDRFVWHSGEWLWTVQKGDLMATPPGELDGHIYTVAKDVQRPWEEAVGHDTTPAARILSYLKTWNWERPNLDPLLFLGWIATAYMGGALKWRPIVFTTGGAGVGKSTLHGILTRIFETSLHATADTTAAGIYQRVKQDSLPVTVDELENKPGSTKATAVIELARIAASGASMFRGGADHTGTTFEARSSFLFSAINPPPLGVQDKSRMAILNLTRLDGSTKALSLDMRDSDGRMMLRQIMDGWDGFQGEILPRWKRALHDGGLDSRAQDTYGTLLAAAELLIGDEAMCLAGVDVTEMRHVGDAIAAATADDRAEQTDNWQACVEHLLSSTIDAWRSGERPTIGGVLEELQSRGGGGLTLGEAQTRLKAAGLGVKDKGKVCDGYALAVPNKGPALEKIFADTIWRGGVWFTALKQGPDDIVLRRAKNEHNVSLNRATLYCQLIDVDAFVRFTAGG